MEDLIKQLQSLSPEDKAILLATLQPQPEKPVRKPRATKKAPVKKPPTKKPVKAKVVEEVKDTSEYEPRRQRPKRKKVDETEAYYNQYDRKRKNNRDRDDDDDDKKRGNDEGQICRVERTPLGARPNEFETSRFNKAKDEAKREEKYWEDKAK